MPSLESSNSALNSKSSHKTLSPWLALISWFIRELTGCVFLFSGFVKAVDPWGTLYKFSEYFDVLGISLPHNLTLTGVVALCALEFLIGIFLIFGCYRRSTPVLAILFMCVMLPLTLWLAIANPISDCGCFGDAIILSNWQTFWKNVFLTACAIFLLKFNSKIHCIITPAFQWLAFTATILYIFVISWYGYNVQPMLDFRPFPSGSLLSADEDDDIADSYFIFTYEKDGIRKDFRVDEQIPDEEDGWKFVERKEISSLNSEASAFESHEFRIWDRQGNEDVTPEVLSENSKLLWILIPSIDEVSPTTTWKINALNDWAKNNDISLQAILALHTGDISQWEDLSMPNYPIFTSEDTSIKEFARGNPAVAYIQNDTVMWKTSLASLNDQFFESSSTKSNISSWVSDPKPVLYRLSWCFVAVLGVLVIISFVPRLANLFRPLQAKKLNLINHGDKAPLSE